jgi:putative SOS response-associated peptidase YedK
MINARAETLTELRSFKLLVDRRRCIIPADGFYEWRKEGKRKVPMWVYLKSKEPFALAGLWDEWRKPDGKKLESFTIITMEPNELIQPIHNRMPVILQTEDEQQWLEASRTPFAKAKSLLKPLSRRADGCSRRFANRQLSEIRWPGVHSTCFR